MSPRGPATHRGRGRRGRGSGQRQASSGRSTTVEVEVTRAGTVEAQSPSNQEDAMEVLGSSSHFWQSDLSEIGRAMVHIEQTTQGTTAASYAGGMYAWKSFCEANLKDLTKYNMDPNYPYTVRSVDMVSDFFKDIVFRRYATRKISLKRNVEIPIGVRDEASSSTNPPPTLQQMLEVAPKDPQGNYTIRVPLSKSAVEQYKKALLRLYQYQEETRPQTITWPSPAASRLIMDQLKAHYLNLVYDSLHTRPNLTASSLYRDAYTPRQLTKVLRKLWMQNNMPELLSISLRHSFVLRDQDLRGLNFGDCFSLVTPFVNNPGSQQPVCFVLCIDKGKTLKNGEVKFACAFRHINIHRCPISGMAFYLFSLMQDNGSFLNEPYWYEYKVVPGRSGPTSERSKAANINSAKAIFESHGFHSSKKTHAGRHSVTIEAESLGVAVDEIKRGGGWKDHLGRLETFYLGKLPWQFARGLAGYLDKPFNLDRNAVKPPIELQRMVFPWIEDFFGADDALWKQTCQEEMDEIDETSTLNTDPYQQQPQPPHQMNDSLSIIHEMAKLGKSEKEKAKRSTRRQAEEPSADEQQHRQEQLRTLYSSNDVAKRGFLKLLLRHYGPTDVLTEHRCAHVRTLKFAHELKTFSN